MYKLYLLKYAPIELVAAFDTDKEEINVIKPLIKAITSYHEYAVHESTEISQINTIEELPSEWSLSYNPCGAPDDLTIGDILLEQHVDEIIETVANNLKNNKTKNETMAEIKKIIKDKIR